MLVLVNVSPCDIFSRFCGSCCTQMQAGTCDMTNEAVQLSSHSNSHLLIGAPHVKIRQNPLMLEIAWCTSNLLLTPRYFTWNL